MSQRATPAKIARPDLRHALSRERLFDRLDADGAARVVWVSAPAGAGKTMLAGGYLQVRGLDGLWYQLDEGDADAATFFYYLKLAGEHAGPRHRTLLPLFTPEYLGGASTFARRFFEQLGAALPPGAVLVFDDYHVVPHQAPLHGLLVEGLAALPAGVRVLVLSRNDPPPAFARLRAAGAVSVMDGEALRLSAEEAARIVSLRMDGAPVVPPAELPAILSRQAQGWAAGLVLLLEQARVEPAADVLADGAPPALVFDYFAHELFNGADPALQDFLLRTALPTTLTVATAQVLSGQSQPERLLGELVQRNLFTVRLGGGEYRYHPLFRAFLLQRAESELGAAELVALREQAAHHLAQSDRIEEAADLLQAAGQWEGLALLIKDHARTLVAQGRLNTLQAWLNALPKTHFEQDPWLIYWLGRARFAANLLGARELFLRAVERFRSVGKVVGVCLAWAGALETVQVLWDNCRLIDDWVENLQGYLGSDGLFPSTEVEFAVLCVLVPMLCMRNPAHPRLRDWAARALHLAGEVEDDGRADVALMIHHTSMGEYATARQLAEGLRARTRRPDLGPLPRLNGIMALSVASYYNADAQPSREAAQAVMGHLEEAIAIAEREGIMMWQFNMYGGAAYYSTLLDEPEASADYLARMAALVGTAMGLNAAFFHHVSSLVAYLQGDLPRAHQACLAGLTLSLENGVQLAEAYARHGAAVVLTAMGDLDGAAQHLRRAQRIAEGCGSLLLRFQNHITRASLAQARGRPGLALRLVRQAAGFAREQEVYFLEFWRPDWLARLCALALQSGVETAFAERMIRLYALPPPQAPLPAAWPWSLRMVTLGHVAVERDGEPLLFGPRGRRKQQALLQLLIALGGYEVSESRLTEALWPDAEGDAAHRSFAITLHRLRGLLGSDALTLQGGRLSLNQARCWVDVWAFERECGALGDALERDDLAQARAAGERLLGLYGGRFLEGEPEYSGSLHAREHLHRLYTEQVGSLGSFLLRHGAAECARKFMERALEVEPLAERFYQCLMSAQMELGRPADVLETYRRCQQVLATHVGAAPSTDTEALALRASAS